RLVVRDLDELVDTDRGIATTAASLPTAASPATAASWLVPCGLAVPQATSNGVNIATTKTTAKSVRNHVRSVQTSADVEELLAVLAYTSAIRTHELLLAPAIVWSLLRSTNALLIALKFAL